LGNINAAGQYDVDGAIAVITLDSPPVNALSAAVRGAIVDGLGRAHADPAVAAVVLICAGKTFIAGAEISELGKPPRPPSFEDMVAALENGPKPVIAAIHGTALGGGLETALLCHYRVADPGARMGLPEVHLGLLPGGGGTQRLPRIIGVEAALEVIVTGRQIGAVEAHRLGIVDALAPAGDLRGGAIGFARAVVAEGRALTRIRDRDDRLAPARGDAGVFERFRQAHPDMFRGFKAPDKILEAVAGAVNLPFDEGIARERALIGALMADRQFSALRYMFFAEREAAKVKNAPTDVAPLATGAVAMLGDAPAAAAAARFFAAAGLAVAPAGGRPDAAPDLLLAVAGAEGFDGLAAGAGPHTIFAGADAAVLPELARATGRPGQVIGLKISGRLLEICRTGQTDAAVIAAAMPLGRRGGKVAVLCGGAFITDRLEAVRAKAERMALDEGVSQAEIAAARYAFGFSQPGDKPGAAMTAARIDIICEALLFPLINEGAAMLADGTAQRVSDIDAAAVLALTWPSYTGGPMFWAASVGLPRVVAGLRGRQGVEPHPLLVRLAESGKDFQSEAVNG
jgi:3-hydroxyacyl-CoA dehydrogenase